MYWDGMGLIPSSVIHIFYELWEGGGKIFQCLEKDVARFSNPPGKQTIVGEDVARFSNPPIKQTIVSQYLSIACKISGLVVFSKEFRNENAFECHFWLMSPHTEECTGQRIEG